MEAVPDKSLGGRGKVGRWKSGLGMTKDTHIEKTARLQKKGADPRVSGILELNG